LPLIVVVYLLILVSAVISSINGVDLRLNEEIEIAKREAFEGAEKNADDLDYAIWDRLVMCTDSVKILYQ
jgi:hypothetical protein